MAKTQKVYNFDGQTGEYLSTTTARKDPMEKNKFLLPANATFDAVPDAGDDEVAVFDDGKWVVKPDFRGSTVEVLGKVRVIDEIGKKPEDFVPTDDEQKAHDDAKAIEIKAYISGYRRIVENGGVEVNGSMIQTDSESRSNLLGASQLGVTVNWKTSNGFVELTSEQVAGIAFMVGTHVQKCFNAERIVYEAHEKKPFASKEDIETTFNNAYKDN